MGRTARQMAPPGGRMTDLEPVEPDAVLLDGEALVDAVVELAALTAGQ